MSRLKRIVNTLRGLTSKLLDLPGSVISRMVSSIHSKNCWNYIGISGLRRLRISKSFWRTRSNRCWSKLTRPNSLMLGPNWASKEPKSVKRWKC